MNRGSLHTWLIFGAFTLTLLVSGCGGRGSVIAECRPDYDRCINHCADRCDQSSQIGPTAKAGARGQGFHAESANTWGSGCNACVGTCAHQAKACEKRVSEPTPKE